MGITEAIVILAAGACRDLLGRLPAETHPKSLCGGLTMDCSQRLKADEVRHAEPLKDFPEELIEKLAHYPDTTAVSR